MRKSAAIICVLLISVNLLSASSFAFDTSANDEKIDLNLVTEQMNEASVPEILLPDLEPSESPLGFSVKVPGGSGTEETSVKMLPGQAGTVTSGGKTYVRWCLDDAGYFTISFERAGTYFFSFTDLDRDSSDATFGAVLIGAGGGGGGASSEPVYAVGSGGSGGEIQKYSWAEFQSGLRISDFLCDTSVIVGQGGEAGQKFYYCQCGGNKCPIGGISEFPQAKTVNSGKNGGDTVFGSLTAKGGNAGIGSSTTGGRNSGKKAPDGENGNGCGIYVFWGVEYRCGYAGGGGSFGLNDGEGGDPIYFHDPGTVSFGRTGYTSGGKGNGGGGSGMSYSFAHPMYTDRGTGQGGGSYSHTVEGTVAKGGNAESYNGYIYLEGRVRVKNEKNILSRYDLVAKAFPDSLNPVPEIEWSTGNADIARVSPAGTVYVYGTGITVITATAVRYGVQGIYMINGSGPEKVKIVPSQDLSKAGDTAVMTAEILNGSENEYVYWYSTNPAVAEINPKTGEIKILEKGLTAITATLVSGEQGVYIIEIR